MRSLSIILLSLVLPFFVIAQTPEIKVLLCKGSVELKPANGKYTLIELVGSNIAKTDTVRLGDNAELALVVGNKTRFFASKGKFTGAQLAKQVNNDGVSVEMASYFNYLMKNLKASKETYDDFTVKFIKERNLVQCTNIKLPVSNTVMLPDKFLFNWKNKLANKLTFAIYTEQQGGSLLLTNELTDSSITVTAKDVALEQGKSYYWQLTGTGFNCERIKFTVLNNDSASVLEKSLKGLKDFNSYGNTLSTLVYCSVCEQHQLYVEAYNAYQQLLKSEPERKDIKQLFASFLCRIGKADEAKVVGNSK